MECKFIYIHFKPGSVLLEGLKEDFRFIFTFIPDSLCDENFSL